MTLTDEGLLAIRNAHEEEYGQYCDQDDFLMVARTIEARVLEELRKQEPVAWVKYLLGESPNFIPVVAGKVFIPAFDVDAFSPLYAAPIPPTVTPSQQKVLSAVDTLLATFDSGYHPELNLIRDFILARSDAPIPTTGETK